MSAMHRDTGRRIEGRDELEQSIDQILGTQRGTRVMRHDYGTNLLELVDVGMDPSGKAKLSQATAEAIVRFEPRIRLSRIATHAEPGSVTFEVQGEAKAEATPVSVRRSL